MNRTTVAIAAFVLLVAPTLQASAQGSRDSHHPAPSASATPSSGPGNMMGAMGGMHMGMMKGHTEGRIAFLKAELKITDAQLPLWNPVAEVIRANASMMHASGGQKMSGMIDAALPDRLAHHEKMMSGHLAGLTKLKAAVGPLYQSLTDEQKKTANELLASPMAMM